MAFGSPFAEYSISSGRPTLALDGAIVLLFSVVTPVLHLMKLSTTRIRSDGNTVLLWVLTGLTPLHLIETWAKSSSCSEVTTATSELTEPMNSWVSPPSRADAEAASAAHMSPAANSANSALRYPIA